MRRHDSSIVLRNDAPQMTPDALKREWAKTPMFSVVVDEVKQIRDTSEAMRAYARQAKNKQLEVDAAEIRIRAERRIGELMKAQRDSIGLNKGGNTTGTNQHGTGSRKNPVPESKPITLAEVGIDKNLADRARKYAAVPEAESSMEPNGSVEKPKQKTKETVTRRYISTGGQINHRGRFPGLKTGPKRNTMLPFSADCMTQGHGRTHPESGFAWT